MYLTDLISKEIYVGKTLRGICRGVGFSPKSFSVKYFLCATAKEGMGAFCIYGGVEKNFAFSKNKETDFAVNFSAVEKTDDEIYLSRLRPAFPKSCFKLFLGVPIFSVDGIFLCRLANAEIYGERITRLIGDDGTTYSAMQIVACSDVLILRKEQPYPIGQRIPAPAVSHILDKREGIVSKTILKSVIQKNALIRFTLTLPPFDMGYDEVKSSK